MRALDRKIFRSSSRQIDVVVASITQLGESVDAIVSSDDNRLSHGGGVSEAIWRAAGPELTRFVARAQPPLRLGQVFVSPAGNLAARAILHAVTMDLDENRVIGPGQLAGLFYRVLATADECEYRSIALPLVGSGAAGNEPGAVIKALEEALNAWLASPTTLTRVVVTIIGQSFEVVRDTVGRLVDRGQTIDEVFRRVQFNHRAPHAALVDRIAQTLAASARTPFETRGPALAVLQESALRLLLAVLDEGQGSLGHDTSRPDERERAISGPSMLSEALRLASGRALEITPELHALLAQGIQARNRLVHASSQAWSPDDVMAVSLATREVLRLIPAPMEPPPEEQADLDEWSDQAVFSLVPDASLPDLPRRRAAAAEPVVVMHHLWTAGSTPDGNDAWQAPSGLIAGTKRVPEGGTAHVRALQKFLQTYLEPSSLDELDARLEQQGYAGSADARLLEHCLRLEDPVKFVASEFSRSQLASALSKLTGHSPSYAADASELAQSILEYLGFPLPRSLGGLAAALAAVEQETNRLRTGVATDISSSVTRVAQQLECICHVLLRFLARAAYDQTPEALFRGWDKLGPSDSLTTAGLGKLIVLVEVLDARLEKDETAVARFFKGSVERRRLFPKAAADLANLRNSFVHYREREASEPYARRLDAALQFLDAARSFVEYLRAPDTRLFPLMVRVTRIEIDAWARRRIHAIDDEGREELIFTDVPLEPGRVYFMQPLSNPVRVDPILVPAGDLVWPEAGRVR
jgi:O-acetyl-ADP-ribose deacetylase (regulator of RNase III)